MELSYSSQNHLCSVYYSKDFIIKMKKISVAVVGLGYWGPNLIRNLLLIPNVTHVYGCDLRKAKIKEIKNKYPNVSLTENYQSIISNNTIHSIIIATPLSTHF